MTSVPRSLDAIRTAEFEAARRVEAARTAASDKLATAQEEARALIEEARAAGSAEAKRRFAAVVAEAERRASGISVGEPVAACRVAVDARAPVLVEAMVDLVLAAPEEPGV